MSETVAEAVVRIRSDESGFDPAGAGKRAGTGYSKGFGGAVKGLGVVLAGTLAAAGVGSFLKGAITGASDLSETMSKTGVVFGAAADDVLAFSDKGAKALGLTKQAALDAASTFGVFGKAAGLSGQDLGTFSTDLVGLSADLASFHNAEPEEVVQALGSALRGEAEPMRKFGVLLDDASLKAEAMKQGLISTTKDALTPQQKTLAAQALILRQTSDAQGDFARTSDGLANQQRILGASFEDLRTKIGAAFLPVAEAAVKGLNRLVEGAAGLGPVIDSLGKTVSGVFSSGGAFGAVGDSLGGIGATLRQFADGLGMAWDVLRSGDDIASGLGETLDFALGNSGKFAGPITDAVVSIMGAFDSLRDAAAQVLPVMSAYFTGSILPAVKGLATFFTTTLLPVFGQIASVIATQVIPTVVAIATFIYGSLLPALITIGTEVATRLRPVFEQLVETFRTQILPTVSKMVEQIRTQLIPALQPLIMKVVAVIGFLAKLAATILGVVLPPVLRLAGFIISRLVPAVVSIITWVVKFVNGLLGLIKTIGSAIGAFARFYVGIYTGVIKAVASVVSAIASLPGKIIGFVSKMVGAGKDLIAGLFRGISGAAGAAGGFISDLAGKIVSAVKGAINDALNLPLDVSLPKVLGGGSVTVIPRLQSGSLEGVAGGMYTVGEVGPERVYLPPGARVLSAAQTRQAEAGGIDYNALALALAAVLGPMLSGQRPIQFMLPTGDPEAAAMATMNRLATVG